MEVGELGSGMFRVTIILLIPLIGLRLGVMRILIGLLLSIISRRGLGKLVEAEGLILGMFLVEIIL